MTASTPTHPARTLQVTLVPGDPPLFALWYIGGANGGHPANCTGHDPSRHPPPSSPSPPNGTASSLQLSHSPSGPWESVLAGAAVVQWRNRNGTWYIACNSAQMRGGRVVQCP